MLTVILEGLSPHCDIAIYHDTFLGGETKMTISSDLLGIALQAIRANLQKKEVTVIAISLSPSKSILFIGLFKMSFQHWLFSELLTKTCFSL